MGSRTFLPSVFQIVAARNIAGRFAFSVDEIFHQVFTLLSFYPTHGGVDFVPTNETTAGITLMLTVGLWKIHYSRAINAPERNSAFQLYEAHFTFLKTVSDVCLSSGLRGPYFAESARILLGVALTTVFCNFFTLLFSRMVFFYAALGAGLACMSGIFMIALWLVEILSCTSALSLDGTRPNTSRVIYMRTVDARPVILTTSFYQYLACAIVSAFQTPILMLNMNILTGS
ncbi:unnamed protein product [Hydatigera taeniaeformis]|uniref:Transmembrane protein n=1 Tax=Hydatigena taeniaeformis TaxID=6205 RepID=A0A0R3X7I7_HYDTA|nr:unnamed protein product [Hydatigera taeniaeformis]